MSLKLIKANFNLDNLGGLAKSVEGPYTADVSLGDGVLPVGGSVSLPLLTACLMGL